MNSSLAIYSISLLFYLVAVVGAKTESCAESNFAQVTTIRNRSEGNSDFIIYGITQDCQIFFARLGDYSIFRGLSTSQTITHCNPDLVKLHIRRYENEFGLVLLIKQPNNRLCTLPIEFPRLSTLSGRKVFSYSLLSTLKFATCSHTSDKSRSTLVPDLSFIDSTFSDILYFIDETSVGPIWTLRQFQMLPSGYLKPLDIYDLKHPAFDSKKLDAYAKDNLVQSDTKSLYIWNRSKDQLHSTCAFNAIFRPKLAKTKTFKVQRRPREWLNSFSVDKTAIVYAESIRTSDSRWDTKILASDLRNPARSVCIGQTNVLLDLNVVSVASLLEMTRKNFSLFGNRTFETIAAISRAKVTAAPASTSHSSVAKVRPPKVQNKSNKVTEKDHDYSNSIFSSDLGYIINLGNLKTPETAGSPSHQSTSAQLSTSASSTARGGGVNNTRSNQTSPPTTTTSQNLARSTSPSASKEATAKVDSAISEGGQISPDRHPPQQQEHHHYEIPTSTTRTTEQQAASPKIDPVHDSSSQDKMVNEAPSSLSGNKHSVIVSSLLLLVTLY